MSTRATIKIVKKGRKPAWMYHHCDGYPDGVGVDLLEFLSCYNKKRWMPNELFDYINQEDPDYEQTDGQHGDEDYGYLIDCDKNTLICYELGWDEFEWNDNDIVSIPGQRNDKVVSRLIKIRLDICNPESEKDPFYRILDVTEDEYEYLKSFVDYQKDECLVNVIKKK